MYPVTRTVAENFKQNAVQYLSILVNPVTGSSFELTDADVLANGLNINRYSANGNSVVLGSCVAAELTLEIENTDGRFNSVQFEGAQLTVSVGTQDGDNVGWVPMGLFTVDTAPRKLDTLSITALDGMVLFDKPVNLDALSLPAQVKNIVRACCNECNIVIDTDIDALPNSSYVVNSVGDTEDLTYRQILVWCCQLMGVCGFMDWQGHLELSWYKKDGIPETVSGSIATFESVTNVPVSQLIVNIEPYQSFNGYDHPWVGGAGENKVDVRNPSGVSTAITKTNSENGSTVTITANNASYAFASARYDISNLIGATIYVNFTKTASSSGLGYVQIRCVVNGSTQYIEIGLSASPTTGKTIPSNATSATLYLMLKNASGDGSVGDYATFNNFILSTTPNPTWTPYENICPIYPANGKNLYNSATKEDGYISATGVVTVDGFSVHSALIPVTPNQPIVFSGLTVGSGGGSTKRLHGYNSSGTWVQQLGYASNVQDGSRYTISATVPSGITGVKISFRGTDEQVQVEHGNVPSVYVPYNAIGISRCGRQLVNAYEGTTKAYIDYEGIIHSSNGWETSNLVPVTENASYTLSGLTSHPNTGVDNYLLYDGNRQLIGKKNVNAQNGYPTQFGSGVSFVRFCWNIADRATVFFAEGADTTYEPYQCERYYPISDNPVYGGTLEVETGVLTVDKAFIEINGDSNIGKESTGWAANYEAFYFSINSQKGIQPGSNIVPIIISNQMKAETYNRLRGAGIPFVCCITGGGLYIEWTSTSADLQAEKARLAVTPAQFAYELATPLVYQLTPTQVELLKGTNNIWADNSTLSVTFPAVTEITPADRFSSDIYENPITITGVSVKGEENEALFGSDEYALLIEGNELITDDDVETIADNLAGLVGFSYYPFQASTLPMPYLYPLDIVAVQYKGQWYDGALTEVSFTASNATDMKSVGESAQTRSYAMLNPLTNRERAIIENLKGEINETLNLAVNQAIDFNQIISNALGLYSTNISDGAGGFIRYLHNAPTLEDSTYIVTETAQGFAWTQSGWNGGSPVWSYGVTSGGYALFKWLSAEGIDVTKASSDYRAQVTPEYFNIYYKNDLIITIDATERAIKTPRMVIPYSATSNNMLRIGNAVWLPAPNGANLVVLEG